MEHSRLNVSLQARRAGIETFMSKGPGRIERALAAIFDGEPGNAFMTEELCEMIYPGCRIEKKHRVAVMRAVAKLAKRRDTLRAKPSGFNRSMLQKTRRRRKGRFRAFELGKALRMPEPLLRT
jgi:hypothetical protein